MTSAFVAPNSQLQLRGFQPGPQDLGNAPGLRDAALGPGRVVAVEDLAHRAQPRRGELVAEWLEQPPRGGRVDDATSPHP